MKYQFEYEDEIKSCSECPMNNWHESYCDLTLTEISAATIKYDFKNEDCPLEKVEGE